MSGSTLGLEVVTCTAGHIFDIRTHIKKLAAQTKAEFLVEFGAIEKIEQCLSKFDQELQKIKDTLQHHGEVIGDHEMRISNTENTLRCQQEVVSKHGKQIDQTKTHTDINRFYTVPPRNKIFVGREEYLQMIDDYLLKSDQSENKITLCGLGGIGKTSIVIEYAWATQAQHYQGGVFWLSGQNSATFENSIRSLAAVIGTLGVDMIETQAKTFNWISLRQGRCLIVIDNVDEEEVHPSIKECITEHVKVGQHNHVIITTRRSDIKAEIDFKCGKCLTVCELSVPYCVQLVKKVLRDENNKDDNDIDTLCEHLHGLPLAIEQAATAIKLNRCMVSEYVEEFKKKRIHLLNNPLPSRACNMDDERDRQSVWTTWKINIDNIRTKARDLNLESAVEIILHLFVCLARDDITIEMINEGKPELEDEELGEIFRNTYRKREVIRLFTEYSVLTDNSDGTFRIHPLVQEFIQVYINSQKSKWRYVAECALAMLNKARKDADGTNNSVLFARLRNQCVALKLHFNSMEDIALKIESLEKRLSLQTHIPSTEMVSSKAAFL